MAIISFSGKSATTSINHAALHGPRRIPRVDGLCLAKTAYTCKMNDLAKSSIRTFPLRFLL